MDTVNFRRLLEHVQASAGLKIPVTKKGFVESRLRKQFMSIGLNTIDEYADYLFDKGGLSKDEGIIFDLLTTNKTDFFREIHHFNFLNKTAFPQFIKAGVGIRRPLRIWSAGCSNGAEPYSLAMACEEQNQYDQRFLYTIHASDISYRMIDEATRAVYPHSHIEPVPQDMRAKYLLRSNDRDPDQVKIVKGLRDNVIFKRINLMDSKYPFDQKFDIIFCRNLLIYFDQSDQYKVINRLCSYLVPGGYLALGHSESIIGFDLPLRTLAATIFQRETD